MAHYAYKTVCHDIDYEHYKELVERFEKEEGREYNGDSNYDGDNWYIAAMWINELRAEIAGIKRSITDPENQPSQYGTVTLEYLDAELTAQGERK